MYGSGVLVVLTNYSRPNNMPAVIRAWRGQSVPVKVVVVDNRLGGNGCREQYPEPNLDGTADVWRIKENLGCPCHFAPALMLYGHKYVILADDDVVPGPRAVEASMKVAETLGDKFATLGRISRLFLPKGGPSRYSGRAVPRQDIIVKCDITCQVHFVRADMFHAVVLFRNRLLAEFGEEAARLVNVHSDFLLCCGIQQFSGLPSYSIPPTPNGCDLVHDRLPGHSDPTALWRRPTHFADRSRLVDMAEAVGWRSLV